MTLIAVNPADGRELARYDELDADGIEQCLERAESAFGAWRARPVPDRAALLGDLAAALRDRGGDLARQASLEMGKPLRESEAEVEKSAAFCEEYAARAEALLAPRRIEGGAVDNYVRYEPLGPLLAVMPWNFPYV